MSSRASLALAAVRAAVLLATAAATALPAISMAEVIGAENIVIGDYTLVSARRISRTVYEYTYRADVSNWGTADATITATLASTAANITVLEGALSFGDVAEGATQASTDTFRIRQNRTQRFNQDALVWSVQATPLPPTTFELIDQALTDGVIDEETALVYKVFYEFNDDRLPAQYLGRDDGFFEATAIQAAEQALDSLSQPTRDLLAPFFMRPTEPGSWNELQTAGQGQNALASPSALAAAASIRWDSVVTANGKARIWWMPDQRPQDAARAQAFKAELDRYLWNKLTSSFREPLADDTVLQDDGTLAENPDPHGPDGLLDIYLTGISRAETRPVAETCDGKPFPVYIVLDPVVDNSVLAHELMHAIVYAYPTKTCQNEYRWMNEATGSWAQHFAYHLIQEEHRAAPDFLGRPEVSLELDEQDAGSHQYGAYLWFFNLSGKSIDPTLVEETWNKAKDFDSLNAIDKAIPAKGGLAEEWPRFVVNNWNRLAEFKKPYRDYYEWDKLKHKAEEMTPNPVQLRLNGQVSFNQPLGIDIPHLAARYFHYDLTKDPAIRSLTFTHPYADNVDPAARVQAIVKIRGQAWKPAEDWTPFGRKKLCLDKPAENVEELVIVISNSEFTTRKHTLADVAILEVSALGCSPFVGTIDFSRDVDLVPDAANQFNGREIRETASTNATFELAPIPNDPTQENLYRPTSVVSTWHHTGRITGPGNFDCSGTKSGVVTPTPDDVGELITLALPPPLGDGSTLYYQGLGRIDSRVSMFIPYQCSGGGVVDTTFGDGASFDWWNTRPLGFDPDENEAAILDSNGDLVLRGDFQREEGDPSTTLTVEKWHWELKQTRRPQ